MAAFLPEEEPLTPRRAHVRLLEVALWSERLGPSPRSSSAPALPGALVDAVTARLSVMGLLLSPGALPGVRQSLQEEGALEAVLGS